MKKQKPKAKQKQKEKSQLDFGADSRQSSGQSNIQDLEQVSELANQLYNYTTLLQATEARLSDLKAKVHRIKMEELPALMDELNISEFKMKDGSKVKVKPLIMASIPSASSIEKERDPAARNSLELRQSRCFSYLRKNGAGALIKTLLEARFGKDSEKVAEKAIAALRKLKVPAEVSKSVHPQTLNAWVRERIEAGKPVDMDLFKVFSGQVAEITTPNLEKVL